MPEFIKPGKIPSRDEAINAIIVSIAMEETALSRVIDAESEKIKLIVGWAHDEGCENVGPEEVLAVNESVSGVLESIVRLQAILKEKFEIASKLIPKPCPKPCPPVPPHPPCPPCPPCPPVPPCAPKFRTPSGHMWCKGNILYLTGKSKCDIRLIHKNCAAAIAFSQGKSFNMCYPEQDPCRRYKNCETLIMLPPGKSYDILFELEAKNRDAHPTPVKIDAVFGTGEIKSIEQESAGKHVQISHRIKFDAPAGDDPVSVFFRLVSPEKLHDAEGSVTISS